MRSIFNEINFILIFNAIKLAFKNHDLFDEKLYFGRRKILDAMSEDRTFLFGILRRIFFFLCASDIEEPFEACESPLGKYFSLK